MQFGGIAMAQIQAVSLQRHLDERLHRKLGLGPCQLLKNAGNRRQCRFVTYQQYVAYALGWLPFITAGVAGIVQVGRKHLQAVTYLGMGGPSRSRAVDAMQHEIYIDFQCFPTQRADGVGPHGWALRGRQGAVRRFPVGIGGNYRQRTIWGGKEQLDPLIGGHGGHPRHIRSGEHQACK